MTRTLVAAVFVVGVSLPLAAEQASTPLAQLPAAAGQMTPRALVGARADVFSTIQGTALSATDAQLPNMIVRLRDARVGRILSSQRTDKAGLFVFRGVEPGSYIVELLGADGSAVLAASEVLTINAGDTVSAIVKLPLHAPPFAAVFGHSVPSAVAVTAEAIASSILAVATRGEPTCPIGPTR